MGYKVQRNVVGRGLVDFVFEDGITPGIASDLASMLQWDDEVSRKVHGPTAKPYSKNDYERVESKFEMKVPRICHPFQKCGCKFDSTANEPFLTELNTRR